MNSGRLGTHIHAEREVPCPILHYLLPILRVGSDQSWVNIRLMGILPVTPTQDKLGTEGTSKI